MAKVSENYYLDSPEFTGVQSGKASVRKNKDKIYQFFLGLLVLVVVALVVVIAVREVTRPTTTHSLPKPAADQVCLLPECVLAASDLLRNMDQAVNPCNDFYSFACGGWMKKATIGQGSSSASTFMNTERLLTANLKNLLEGKTETSDVPGFNDTKRLYQSCLAQVTKAKSAQPLLSQYFDLFGAPFVSNSWPPSSLEEYYGKLKSYYYSNPIISMTLGVDDKNTSIYRLQFDMPGLYLGSYEYYTSSTYKNVLNTYKEVLTELLTFLYEDFNVTKTKTDIGGFVQKVIDMETYVARLYLYTGYNERPVQYLQDNAPKINWTLFINTYLEGAGVVMNNNSKVLIAKPTYLQYANNLVGNYTLEEFGIFTTISIMMYNMNQLPIRYRNSNRKLKTALYGSPGTDMPWATCIAYIQNNMYDHLDRAYVQKYFNAAAKTEVEELVVNLKQAFAKQLKNNTWMDKATKAVALEKAIAMKANIAYPDIIMNDKYMVDTAAAYNFTNDFVNNDFSVLSSQRNKQMKLLKNPVDKTEWITRVAIANAFYMAVYNQIYIPAGQLQSPFFSMKYPRYINYGAVGTISGHEITHGFDDYGSTRDKDGILRQWWKKEIVANFNKQAECMVNQYGKFTTPSNPPLKVNGRQTLGENIADNGGIKQAFEAYKIWERKYKRREQKLPGLAYTPEQMFFVSFAQGWCEKMLDASWSSSILTDSHSPGMFRVLGTIANSVEFATVFNCSKNSPMNPDKKCVVW